MLSQAQFLERYWQFLSLCPCCQIDELAEEAGNVEPTGPEWTFAPCYSLSVTRGIFHGLNGSRKGKAIALSVDSRGSQPTTDYSVDDCGARPLRRVIAHWLSIAHNKVPGYRDDPTRGPPRHLHKGTGRI